MAEIKPIGAETLNIKKHRENYSFNLSISTVQQDERGHFSLINDAKYIGDYDPETRKLVIGNEVGESEFILSKEEAKKFEKGLKMLKKGELPVNL